MKQLKLKLILMLVVLSGAFSVYAPTVSALDCTRADLSSKEQIQCGACNAAGTTTTCDPSSASGSLTQTIKDVIQILSVIAGAAAVVMIVVGGFRYVTSSGNAEATKSARNTIVYALVGLVIIALAQIIVHFTLNSVVNPSSSASPPTGSSGQCVQEGARGMVNSVTGNPC
jgi:hypothetical protein